MSCLSQGGDPIRDFSGGVWLEPDLNKADLAKIRGLSVSKDTVGLQRARGSESITYLAAFLWNSETAAFARTLPNLERLHVSGIRGPLPEVGSLPSLRILTMHYCPGLETLNPFVGCTQLETLWLSGCLNFKTLDGIAAFPNLLEFEIQGSMTQTGKLESLAPISVCGSLKYLALAAKIADKDLTPICQLRNLDYLWLQNRFKAEQYRSILEACPSLQEIDLHNGRFDRSSGFQEDEE